ncbi:hypothetical protein FOG51_02697 [Hanseniaspora uvarum]|nr:hypothetical protein FOG51_02697 [Hanseniaspora uvarum]KAF0275572.1 hypothetical protein FOG50_03607 [Hanseniaspora uvarum]
MTDERYTPVKLSDSNLFKPLKLNDNITLQHRAAMAPLTRHRADEKYVLKQDLSHWEEDDWKKFAAEPANKVDSVNKKGLVTEYYHQRSERPGTLIISEATFISAKAGGYDTVPGIWNDEQVASLTKVIDAIHANKSYMFVQLWNLGRQADPIVLKNEGFEYLSASAVYPINDNAIDSTKKAKECGNPLKACSIQDIEDFKRDYLVAARNAFKAGADGVEIHSANGYLLNQFIDLKINKRTDQYGPQSFENRSRFLFEVLDSLVEEFGGDKVALRLSPFGTFGDMSGDDSYPETIQMYTYIYQELEKRRAAGKGPVYLSLVEPRVTNPFLTEGEGVLATVNNEFAYDYFKGVILRAGDLVLGNKYTKEIINKNDRTLAGFGRYWISNPDLVDRLEKELPLNKYDRNTFYAETYKGYIDYPFYKQ